MTTSEIQMLKNEIKNLKRENETLKKEKEEERDYVYCSRCVICLTDIEREQKKKWDATDLSEGFVCYACKEAEEEEEEERDYIADCSRCNNRYYCDGHITMDVADLGWCDCGMVCIRCLTDKERDQLNEDDECQEGFVCSVCLFPSYQESHHKEEDACGGHAYCAECDCCVKCGCCVCNEGEEERCSGCYAVVSECECEEEERPLKELTCWVCCVRIVRESREHDNIHISADGEKIWCEDCLCGCEKCNED